MTPFFIRLACFAALAFSFSALAADDNCDYAPNAYGSYGAVERSNLCASSTVSQTLPTCIQAPVERQQKQPAAQPGKAATGTK